MTQPIDVAYVEVLPDFSKFVGVLRSDLNRVLRSLEREADRAFEGVEDAAQDAGRAINISITIGAQKAERAVDDFADAATRDFGRVERSAQDAGREIGRSFGREGGQALTGLTGTLTQLGQALLGLGFAAPSPAGLIAVLGILSLLAAAVGPVLAVTAALADLVGLIGLAPAGIAIAAAAIVPLVVAFQNFGDAVKAISEGDLEKIEEALAKLSPSAAAVAREIGTLLPQLRELQRSTQEAFFAPLHGVLSELVNVSLPLLTQGFTAVAAAFGRLFAEFGRLLGENDIQEAFGDLFGSVVRILDRLGPTAVRVFGTLVGVMEAGLPFVERIVAALNDGLLAFDAFLGRSLQSGGFQKFIEDAFATFRELVDLTKALGGLLITIFAAGDDEGRSFIATLTDLVQRMDAFFKSAEGQDALNDLFDTVKLIGGIIGGVVNAIVFLIDVLTDLDDIAEEALADIVVFFQSIGDFIASIPGKVGAFLSSLPAVVAEAFKNAATAALLALGVGIGAILFAIQVLPGKIVEIIASIPGRAETALLEFGPRILGVLAAAFGTARQFVIDRFNEIVEFIRGTPDRITGLGPNFLQAGKNLITSFVTGFRQVGTFIGDVAGDIVGAVRGFLNRAIDRINDGIAIIDAFLPGSLSRIPRLALGGIVPATAGGQLVVAGEGGESEVIAPLSKLEDMMAGPSITFGPGSINVSFEGVVPSEQEAFRTGQQVGVGLLSTLARRDIRMQVRAI